MTSDNKDVNNSEIKTSRDPQFSPEDLTDGRTRGNWKTRFPDKQAKSQISKEAAYLIILLIVCFILLFLIICNVFQRPFGFSESQSLIFNQYLGILVAGIIGGTLFDLKWLIHSVGKGSWNEDRKIWRYFTPITSGVLSIFVMLVMASGLFGLFNTAIIDNVPLTLSLAFLSGYFSDYVVGRLQDLFQHVMGADTHSNNPTNDQNRNDSSPKNN